MGNRRTAYQIARALMDGGEPRRVGQNWRTLCPAHDDHDPSLDIKDSDKGDHVLFVCRSRDCSFDSIKDALIARNLWDEPGQMTAIVYTPIMPVPKDAPPPPNRGATHRWSYVDSQNRLLGYIERVNLPNGKKDFFPLTYCRSSRSNKRSWTTKSFIEPRPLWNLYELTTRPDAHVIVVEGEKAGTALKRMLAGLDYVVTTWPGGGSAVSRADWVPLVGREVTIWPDADVPGLKSAFEIRSILAKLAGDAGGTMNIGIIELPEGLALGWDAADAKAEGWSRIAIRHLIESTDIGLDREFAAYDRDKPEVWNALTELLKPVPAPFRKRYLALIKEELDGPIILSIGIDMKAASGA